MKLHFITTLGTLQQRMPFYKGQRTPMHPTDAEKQAFLVHILGRHHQEPVSGLVLQEPVSILITGCIN